jgi:predicted ATPase
MQRGERTGMVENNFDADVKQMIGRMIRERREDGRKTIQIIRLITYAQTLLDRPHHRPHQRMTESRAALLLGSVHHALRKSEHAKARHPYGPQCTPYLTFSVEFPWLSLPLFY